MHKSRLGGLIIDCQTDKLEEAGNFWTRALGYDAKKSPESEAGRYIALQTASEELYIELQKVDHPSRVHLDIETDDVDAEVARLEKLGARKLEKFRTWWVMEAPTGHRFCVVKAVGSDFEEKANRWS